MIHFVLLGFLGRPNILRASSTNRNMVRHSILFLQNSIPYLLTSFRQCHPSHSYCGKFGGPRNLSYFNHSDKYSKA